MATYEACLLIHKWATCPVRHTIEVALGWKVPTRHPGFDPHSVRHCVGAPPPLPPLPCLEIHYYDGEIWDYTATWTITIRTPTFPLKIIITKACEPWRIWKRKGTSGWTLQPERCVYPYYYREWFRWEQRFYPGHDVARGEIYVGPRYVSWASDGGPDEVVEFRETQVCPQNNKRVYDRRFRYLTTTAKTGWVTRHLGENEDWWTQ